MFSHKKGGVFFSFILQNHKNQTKPLIVRVLMVIIMCGYCYLTDLYLLVAVTRPTIKTQPTTFYDRNKNDINGNNKSAATTRALKNS